MNELIAPQPGQILLLQSPPDDALLALIARLALAGPLLALDAGNQFNAYHIARLIRRRTHHLDPALGRVRLARAFTCYQVVALFEQLLATPMPHIIFDLPATFHDESVPPAESRRLLSLVLAHLGRLRPHAPIIISARPVHPARRPDLLHILTTHADRTLIWQPTTPIPTQPRLF